MHPLPGGGRVILVADTTQTTQMMGQLRRLMIGPASPHSPSRPCCLSRRAAPRCDRWNG
ncbi:hypothetical protein I552_5799 [Mycobacterium xenopi 3993]|nr:hypothetical protein I552_5799 [Mycobacterium xenopi 3993]